jgi:hypothetical protein
VALGFGWPPWRGFDETALALPTSARFECASMDGDGGSMTSRRRQWRPPMACLRGWGFDGEGGNALMKTLGLGCLHQWGFGHGIDQEGQWLTAAAGFGCLPGWRPVHQAVRMPPQMGVRRLVQPCGREHHLVWNASADGGSMTGSARRMRTSPGLECLHHRGEGQTVRPVTARRRWQISPWQTMPRQPALRCQPLLALDIGRY